MVSPDVVAELDQLEAGIGAHVDALVETFRQLRARPDGVRAGADVCALLTTWQPVDVAAVAAVAIGRLAAHPSEGS